MDLVYVHSISVIKNDNQKALFYLGKKRLPRDNMHSVLQTNIFGKAISGERILAHASN